MKIRPATMADAEVIAQFNLAMALETEGRKLDSKRVGQGVVALLSDANKGTYYIAEMDGKVAGQLLITYEWSDWRNGNFWWIQSVYVAPEFRSSGVFKTLFEHVQALAKSSSDGCGLRLYVERDNVRAQGVYQRLGMSKTNYDFYELDFVLSH